MAEAIRMHHAQEPGGGCEDARAAVLVAVHEDADFCRALRQQVPWSWPLGSSRGLQQKKLLLG